MLWMTGICIVFRHRGKFSLPNSYISTCTSTEKPINSICIWFGYISTISTKRYLHRNYWLCFNKDLVPLFLIVQITLQVITIFQEVAVVSSEHHATLYNFRLRELFTTWPFIYAALFFGMSAKSKLLFMPIVPMWYQEAPQGVLFSAMDQL